MRAINPDTQWAPSEHLLALLIDITQMGNWQRGGDSKAKRPQPIARPGDARRAEERSAELHRRWRETRQPED